MFFGKEVRISEPIVDFHVHLLPNVDDGPASTADAVEMARILSTQGVSTVVATPHFVTNTDCYGPEYIIRVKEEYKSFLQRLKEEGIPLKLYQGFEVHASEEMMYYEHFDELAVDTTRYMMVEVPFCGDVYWLEDFVYTLQIKDIKPIIVHPERCSCLGENLERLKKLASSGAIVQLNAGSFYGMYGKRVQRIVMNIMKMEGTELVFGSDSHNIKHANQIKDYLGCIMKSSRGSDLQKFLIHNAHSILGI